MHYVTTCHLDGFNQYGRAFLDGWKHFPKGDSLTWYTEGYSIPNVDRVDQVDNRDLDRLQAFKDRHKGYRSPYYLWDVVRFSHKVFAVYDAMRHGKGLMAWIDADMVPFADIPEGWAESLLKSGDYIAMFQRKGFHSECGFWIVDCDHPAHGDFMDTLIGLYEHDEFKHLREWHDSYLMDVVCKEFRDRIGITNLTTNMEAEHPMSEHPMAQWLDHLKGPARKREGVSPENQYRKAA